jgi:predicted regulator of Ras-like GTPase activity (Roadblock/LC7/MglB family)
MQALAGLRDVQGVHGSFVLSEAGGLLGRDLPAVFHDDLLGETGPRIVRLCEALEHGGEALDTLALRFTDHKLHIRRSRGGFLCVIADVTANAPALKMALALVVRRLGASDGTTREHSGPPPTMPPITQQTLEGRPSTVPPPLPSKKPPLFYRGYRMED